MRNSIAERIADFLADFEPFTQLTNVDLLTVANKIGVLNLEKNQILFKIDDVLHSSFYVVASGKIGLTTISDAEETLLNQCVTGDIFGLRPFFAKNNYLMTAKATEDCIVYAIPIAVFRPFVANNEAVLDFLLQSFASTAPKNGGSNKTTMMKDGIQKADNQSEIQYFQTFEYNKNPLLVAPTATVQSVAQKMNDNLYGCAVVHEQNLPVGIITDVDLRNKIATGKFYITTLAQNIMTTPVLTVPENLSLAEAQLFMLKNNVTHLCVTADGSDNTAIKGVISQQDLIAAQANNPGVLIKQIKRATAINELKDLRLKLTEFIRVSVEKRIPLSNISAIVGEINISIHNRIIELNILKIGSAPARFAWLCIGSQGRKEQLLLSDQDNMLVFEDVAADKYQEVKDYFLNLAQMVNSDLEIIGYKVCENGHVAKNIFWCKSLSDWNKQYNNWINTPGEKTNEIINIFFDYEIAHGEIGLEEAITLNIFDGLKSKKKFLAFLATDALKKPAAINFFKNFNLEEEGANQDLFDLKNRGLAVFIDIARVLILSHEMQGFNNTFLRFKQLAIIEPKYSEVYLEAADSFLTLSKFRVVEGIKANNNGSFINLEILSKLDKEKLKNCFSVLKDLEEIVKNKFSLTYFS
jgi:CBS domain-containing protein